MGMNYHIINIELKNRFSLFFKKKKKGLPHMSRFEGISKESLPGNFKRYSSKKLSHVLY
jgi:hypothetical protein